MNSNIHEAQHKLSQFSPKGSSCKILKVSDVLSFITCYQVLHLYDMVIYDNQKEGNFTAFVKCNRKTFTFLDLRVTCELLFTSVRRFRSPTSAGREPLNRITRIDVCLK
jgi:hypothetical protein